MTAIVAVNFLTATFLLRDLWTCGLRVPEDISEEAQLLREHWATPDGGFIHSDHGDGRAIGVSLEKKRIMLDTFLEADPYRKAASVHSSSAM